MGRKPAKPTIVVSVKGSFVAWNDGHFGSKDKELVKEVRNIAMAGIDKVRVHALGEPVLVGSDNPRSAAAAIMAVDPGRSLVVIGGELIFNDEEKGFADFESGEMSDDELDDELDNESSEDESEQEGSGVNDEEQ